MKTIETSTQLCPILSVGMYQSVLGMDYQLENNLDYLELPHNLYSKAYDGAQLDIKGYKKALAEFAKDTINEALESLDIPIGIVGPVSIWSPREYNFTEDSLEFNLRVPDNILDRIKDSDSFDYLREYYIENYGSREGFYSFAPRFEELLEEPTEKNITYLVSAYVAYQLEHEIEQHDFEMSFCEQIEFSEFYTLPNEIEKEIEEETGELTHE